MQASRMCQGATKSGSPTPSDMTSGMPSTISKNFRMPEGGTDLAAVDILSFIVTVYGETWSRLFFSFS
ncbi:hypothetical protein BMS3Bbin16_00087 [archaeon BMS3Bbin16]|nr:hypothetical protein BMS3Bbin16_00087 [archaeon BMS3Bbin16]